MRVGSVALVAGLVVAAGCKREAPVAPAPRPLATGELVIRPGQGVVQIEGPEDQDGRPFIRLKHPSMTLHVPAENLAKVVRRPIAPAQAQGLLAKLRSHDGDYDRRRFEHRYRDGMRALVKGTLERQVELLHGFYLSPYQPSFGERRLIMTLEDVVLGELVLAMSAPKTLEDLQKQRAALAEQLHAGQPVFSSSATPRPREAPLEPDRPPDPFKLPDVEYLGTFKVTSGKIVAGDPALVGATEPGPPERAAYQQLDAVSGHGTPTCAKTAKVWPCCSRLRTRR